MVVDNVDYTSGMEKNMSREFTDLADTLCLGVSHEIYCDFINIRLIPIFVDFVVKLIHEINVH